MNKPLAFLLVLLTSSLFGQKSEPVELNWKINPGDTLRYLTAMNEIDTSNVELNFNGLFDALSDSTNENIEEAKRFFAELNKSIQNIDLLTTLTSKGNGIIDIIMQPIPEGNAEEVQTDTTDDKMAQMMKVIQSMTQGILLRGSVYENGGIHSFWLKSNQKNLIATFFELPQKPVKVGDSWEIKIDFIANDQNFICDTSFKKNKVQLTELNKINGETIAVIKYDIVEFVDGIFTTPSIMGDGGPIPTMMEFNYQAIGEFSIEKGKWVSYTGIMGMVTTGFMVTDVKKKFSLIEEKMLK